MLFINKRIWLSFAYVFFIVLHCFGQSYEYSGQPNNADYAQSKSKQNKKHHGLIIPFQVGISYGYLSYNQIAPRTIFAASSSNIYGQPVFINYFNLGVIGISGRFVLLKHVKFGLDITYENIRADIQDDVTKVIVGKQTHQLITIMPRMDAIWYSKKWVRLYSTMSAGVAIDLEKTKITPSNASSISTLTRLAGQLSPLGLEIGKKFSGTLELGYGYKGVVNVGFRYEL